MATDKSATQLVFGGTFLAGAAKDGTRPLLELALQSIKKAVDEHDWRTIVAISRRLYANMGVPKGAINLKAMLSVGRAWDPVYLGQKADWGEKATTWLTEEYFPMYNVRGPMFDFKTDLYLDSVTVDRCGDFFYLLTGSGDGFPMTQAIPNHLVRSPKGSRNVRNVDIVLKVPRHLVSARELPDDPETGPLRRKLTASYVHNGIAYNSANRPFAYCVHEEDERAMGFRTPADPLNPGYEWVHEQYIVHIFDPEYYEQGRGLPAYSHAVRQFVSMLTSQEFEEITQMVLSSISLVETNEDGTTDATDPTTAIGATGDATLSLAEQETAIRETGEVPEVIIEKIVGGVVKYFKSGTGGKVEPMAKTSPGDIWEKFQDRLVRVALAGTNMPYSIVWKGNDDNGTSNRVSIEKLHLTIEDRQSLLSYLAYRKICYGVAVAMNTGRLEKNPEDWWAWGFTMPPEFTIDDGRIAKSRREDYVLGHENLTPILGSKGRTLIPFLRQRAKEIAMRKKIAAEVSTQEGVPIEDWEMMTINPQKADPGATGDGAGGGNNPPPNPDNNPND